MAYVNDVFGAILLGGTLGLVGQGARAAIGLKKMNDTAQDQSLGWSDVFVASRLVVSLIIGFLAGVAGTFALGIDKLINLQQGQLDVLFGIVAAGYAGTDAIEAFIARIGTSSSGTKAQPSSSALAANVAKLNANVSNLAGIMANPPAQPAPAAAPSAAAPPSELQADMTEATKYIAQIKDAAAQCNLAPSLICAIGSRESNWGQGSDMHPKGPAGTGDWAARDPARWGYAMPPDGLGWGRGLMQVDYAQSEFGKTGDWRDPGPNILFGAEELAGNITYYKAHPHVGVDPVAAAAAAYNCGPGNVNKAIAAGKDVDAYTTGHDYSKDVLARAAWFKDHGFDNLSG